MEKFARAFERKKTNHMMAMFLTGALIFFPAAGSTQSQSTGTKIPTEVVMKVPSGVKNRKAPVYFPHAPHRDFDCTLCHHNAYETLVMNKCSTEGCHSNTQKREGTDSFYAAFHGMFEEHNRSCLDCHKSGGRGPIACKGCHQQR